MLKHKNTVVFGAAGSMGSAIAHAFARQGATVFLAGRTQASLDEVARDIIEAGGKAETAQVDAHDPGSVETFLDAVTANAGSVDVCLNAVDHDDVQGIALIDMSLHDYLTPITLSARTHFVTSTAAARHMVAQGSGVIVMLSSSAARESGPSMGGFSIACAGIECLTRTLAAEIGPHGVRVVALRPNFTPETNPDIDLSEIRDLIEATALGRLPRLAEVAATAAFLASDDAGAITGAVVNLTCGAIVD